MLKKVVYVALLVSDQDKALDFYTNVIGLEKRGDYPTPAGPRFLTVGVRAGLRPRSFISSLGGADMITGVHAVIFTTNAEQDRAFFRDVLELPFDDAGDGWLIFALPPAELAAHPADEDGRCELYLMCDDVDATIAELQAKGVDIARPVSDERFGLMTSIRLPGGGELGLYEPRHPTPLSVGGSMS